MTVMREKSTTIMTFSIVTNMSKMEVSVGRAHVRDNPPPNIDGGSSRWIPEGGTCDTHSYGDDNNNIHNIYETSGSLSVCPHSAITVRRLFQLSENFPPDIYA